MRVKVPNPFDSTEEVLTLANDIEYGLEVWSGRDMSSALKMLHRIKAGMTRVNCYCLVDLNVGFAGIKMRGYGVKNIWNYIDAYLYTKSVYISGG